MEKKLNLSNDRILSNILDLFERHNISYDLYPGCSEKGYEDVEMLCSNWNNRDYHPFKMSRLCDFIENRQIIEIDWNDEYIGCSECYKAIRTIADCYSWEPSFIWVNDCELLCRDHWGDNLEDIIEYYKNSINRALPSDFMEKVEKAGWKCYSPNEYCKRYETGFHPGQTDNPLMVVKEIEAELPDHDYLFVINSKGQFDINWHVFIRKQDD